MGLSSTTGGGGGGLSRKVNVPPPPGLIVPRVIIPPEVTLIFPFTVVRLCRVMLSVSLIKIPGPGVGLVVAAIRMSILVFKGFALVPMPENAFRLAVPAIILIPLPPVMPPVNAVRSTGPVPALRRP